MREYLEWQQDTGPVKIRVHRRVLAGLEARAAGARGIVLGRVSPETPEVVVEDFAILGAGGFDSHVLPAVGYFRSGELTDEDREFLARQFAGQPHVVLLLEPNSDGLRIARILVNPDGLQSPRRAAGAPSHRVLFRADPPPVPVEEEAEDPTERWRRRLWPAVAIVGGFLIGVVAYTAMRGSPPAEPPPVARHKDPMPVPPPMTEAPAPAPAQQPSQGADRAAETAPEAPRTDAPFSRAEVQQQVRAALDHWRESLLRQNVEAYVNAYAPTVGPYFTKSRATRADIAAETRQMIKRYGPIREHTISDLSIGPSDANHAVVNFRKQWGTAGDRFAGAEREQLKFARHGSEWLITSEQELKVYWVRRK
jgi:hypothetical protein